MRLRKKKPDTRPAFIARIRIEPKTREELDAFFEWMLDNLPKDVLKKSVFAPEDWHKSAFLYFGPWRARNWKAAEGALSFHARRKFIKPSGVSVKSYAIQVREVVEGDDWPENWFSPNNVDALGSPDLELPE